jgi:hypothetical protein
MKKNNGIFALVLGIVLMGCPTEPGPVKETFTGTADGTTYTLTITDGTSYVLTVGGKTSSGAAEKTANGYSLTPSNSDTHFTVTAGNGGITAMSGTITFTDNSTATAPAVLTPPPATDGNGDNNETIAGVWLCTIDSDNGFKFTIVKDGNGYTFIQETKGHIAYDSEDWVNHSKGIVTLTGTNVITATVTHYWTHWESNPGWSSDSLESWNENHNNNSGLTSTGNISGTSAGSTFGEAPYIFVKQ